MSDPKNQHIIPQCYLKQFVDPKTPTGYEPYVWIFECEARRGKKKAPKNILAETDFYTLKGDYVIEKTLEHIGEIIKKHRDRISSLMIAIVNLPNDHDWQERQEQLSIINKILSLNIPVPILTDEETYLLEESE